MKKQFYHKMTNDRFTAVVEVPTKDEFASIIAAGLYHNVEVGINCGITKVIKKDQYVKKIGREYAIKAIRTEPFILQTTDKCNGVTQLIMETTNNYDSSIKTLIFEISINRKKVYLTHVGI